MNLHDIVTGLLLLACSAMILAQVRTMRRLRASRDSLLRDVERLQLPRSSAELRKLADRALIEEQMAGLARAMTRQVYGAQAPGPAAVLGLDALAPPDSWAEKADAFQKAYADAKTRLDEAEIPHSCVYEDCVEEPTSSIVDAKGHTTGLCDRHARAWAKLDEDQRRRVRTGGAA